MQLLFSSSRLNNSTVDDAQTGARLYDVQTPTTLGTQTTTVRNAHGEVVAVYERHGLRRGTVTVGGSRMDIESCMPRDSAMRM